MSSAAKIRSSKPPLASNAVRRANRQQPPATPRHRAIARNTETTAAPTSGPGRHIESGTPLRPLRLQGRQRFVDCGGVDAGVRVDEEQHIPAGRRSPRIANRRDLPLFDRHHADPACRAISAVRSVESSSTTSISNRSRAILPRHHRSNHRPPWTLSVTTRSATTRSRWPRRSARPASPAVPVPRCVRG